MTASNEDIVLTQRQGGYATFTTSPVLVLPDYFASLTFEGCQLITCTRIDNAVFGYQSVIQGRGYTYFLILLPHDCTVFRIYCINDTLYILCKYKSAIYCNAVTDG